MARISRINLRVSPEEVARIRERMEEVGTTNMSAFMISMSINGYIVINDLTDLKEILRLLQIAGNNINQYAKKANETGSIYLEDINEIKKSHKKLIEGVGNVIDYLMAVNEMR